MNFLASRVHGPELGLLKVFVGPAAEISSICGAAEVRSPAMRRARTACTCLARRRRTARCRSSTSSPTSSATTSPTTARTRSGRPSSIGPEYWATSQFICAGALSEPPVFFPGDEDQHYLENPGEGWADTYAHLPENGFESAPFQFSPLFHRDQAAFDAIRKDIFSALAGQRDPHRDRDARQQHEQERFALVVGLDGPSGGPAERARAAPNFDLQVRLGGEVRRQHPQGGKQRPRRRARCARRRASRRRTASRSSWSGGRARARFR